jgi:hypothetical protein
MKRRGGGLVKTLDTFDADFIQIQGDGALALYWGDLRYERAACAGITGRRLRPRLARSGQRARSCCGVGPATAAGRTPGCRDGGQVIVDLDVTLVTAHSEKEDAEPRHKRGYGFTPMCAFVDHGEHGTGETLNVQLRPGRPHRGTSAITSRPSTPRWSSRPRPSGHRCWCASTLAVAPKRSCTTSLI